MQFDAEVREWIVRPFTLWDIQTHSAQLLHTTYLLACVCACVCVCVCVCPASPVSSHGCFLSVPLWVCRTSQPPPVSGGRLQEKYKHTGDPFKTPSQTRVGFPTPETVVLSGEPFQGESFLLMAVWGICLGLIKVRTVGTVSQQKMTIFSLISTLSSSIH